LSGSGRLDGQILSPPTEIGNRHDQQMSVIGLTKLPVQRPGRPQRWLELASMRPSAGERCRKADAKAMFPAHGRAPLALGRTISLTSRSAALLAHARRHRADAEVA
jgi:hypothetical protein